MSYLDSIAASLAHTLAAGGNDAPVDAASFLGGPLGMLGADVHLRDGLGERLALVERERVHERGTPPLDLLRDACQVSRARERREPRPRRLAYPNSGLLRSRHPSPLSRRLSKTTSIFWNCRNPQLPPPSRPMRLRWRNGWVFVSDCV